MTDDPQPVASDAEARRRIRHQLDQTLFVEAGAGTGKTRALVGRIVELVATGTAPMREIAAITFTEAAAGELRDRLRQALEQVAADPDGRLAAQDDLADPALGADEHAARAARAAEAVGELDGAAISTLHGFAQRILAEHPFEAGLPPTFEVFDQIRSRVAFDERWGAFLDEILDDPGLRPTLARALVTGVTLDHLRSVALELDRNWDLVEHLEVATAPAEPVEVGTVVSALQTAGSLTGWCRTDDDHLLRQIQDLAGWTAQLAASTGDLARLQLLVDGPALKPKRGRKENWDDRNEEVGRYLAEAEAAAAGTLRRAQRQALGVLLVHLQRLTLQAAAERARDGTLAFHDLLVQARRLVRTQPDVAARLHDTYTRLLIDEFQDTDPIQIELAVRIATDRPDPDRPWRELPVPPGRLFFVGDPKQSIYRFRRADVALFLEIRGAQDTPPLSLTRNHRSVPGVLEWVNAMFDELLGAGDPDVQPAYEALAPFRPGHPTEPDAARGSEPPSSSVHVPPVVLLGGTVAKEVAATISQVRTGEAADVARAVARARDEGWPVGPEDRPATLADVCVLIPTRTSLPALERALDRRQLPYRVESSSLVYATAEVRDLLNVLRAVDDPTDSRSVVAALRSAWFGCGDDDLYRYRAAGGHWDYRRAHPDGLGDDHPVTDGLDALAALHDRRWWLDPSALIEQVLVDRRVLELGLDEGRPRDVWRRLRFVVDQARAFTDAYGTDLRRYLAWAELQAADDARVVEAVLPESDDDAVRIMTVHASKGLEFPVVVLAGLNTERRAGAAGVDVLWDGTHAEVKLRKGLDTAGYVDLAEREKRIEQAEQRRLLYVAATRAQDHLVVSLHHKAAPNPRCQAADLEALADRAPHLWHRLSDLDPGPGRPPRASHDPAADLPGPEVPAEQGADDDDPGARQRWIDERRHALAAAARPTTLAATGVAKQVLAAAPGAPDDAGEAEAEAERPERVVDATPWRRGRAGTAVGRAVHGVLQRIDLVTGAHLEALAASQAGAEGVADRSSEVERLAAAALGSETVRAALASGRYWREVYVGAPVAGRTLEGFVDLLFDGPDGLTVVDYKTDAVRPGAPDQVSDSYRLQGASYAVALEQALGRPVVSCVLLFLRSDGAVARPVVDLDGAKAQVRATLSAV